MPRRLVISLPACKCISCEAEADGELRHVENSEAPEWVNVYFNPPPGWFELETRYAASSPPRRFVICGTCHEKGAPFGLLSSKTITEAAP
jgi:hypothetical protein